MPIESCESGGKPGFRYGIQGKCYTYNPGDRASRDAAKKKAIQQGVAIEQQRGGKFHERDQK